MSSALDKVFGVRTSQRLYPWREPKSPAPAATLLLLRDSPSGIEVLMTRRSTKASFAPGAFVFPGGVVDRADATALGLDPDLFSPSRLLQGSSESPKVQRDLHQIYAQAALRECWEELHLLLAGSLEGGGPLDFDMLSPSITGLARHPEEGFDRALAARDLRACIEAVYSFSHWTTDRDLTKRFDVRFLVARAPLGQSPLADEGEQFEPCWVQPSEALARHVAGDFYMIFPTIRTLEQLKPFACVDDVLEHANRMFEQGSLWRSCPRGGYLHAKDMRFTEDEMPFAELELVSPDGQLVHHLDWQHEHAVPLLRYLYRYTAPNPGRMTGPGTNTYLLGDEAAWTVIDPGPDLSEHVNRLLEFTKNRITQILCTHSHLDHSPGAFSLQAAIRNASGIHVPILGRPSGPTVDSAQSFKPDQILHDGDRIRIKDELHLLAIHTPGHASNHVCFLIEEDGILISGDHVMNGSTVVINPPDGDMSAYIESLERLERLDLNYILPAHGYVLGSPAKEIRRLIEHRLSRERKVYESLNRLCEAGNTAFQVDEIVPGAYQDVPAALHGLAARSLLAHLLKLQQDGRVIKTRDGWRTA